MHENDSLLVILTITGKGFNQLTQALAMTINCENTVVKKLQYGYHVCYHGLG